jgi:hypothetical protein
MTKELDELSIDELNALPEVPHFGRDTYPVVNGEARLRDGRVLTGLVGTHVHVPVARRSGSYAFKPSDPAFWVDNEGHYWRPVYDEYGNLGKQRCGF